MEAPCGLEQGLTSAELLTAAQLPIYLTTHHSQRLRAQPVCRLCSKESGGRAPSR